MLILIPHVERTCYVISSDSKCTLISSTSKTPTSFSRNPLFYGILSKKDTIMASFVPSMSSFKKQGPAADREKLEKDQVSCMVLTKFTRSSSFKLKTVVFAVVLFRCNFPGEHN